MSAGPAIGRIQKLPWQQAGEVVREAERSWAQAWPVPCPYRAGANHRLAGGRDWHGEMFRFVRFLIGRYLDLGL